MNHVYVQLMLQEIQTPHICFLSFLSWNIIVLFFSLLSSAIQVINEQVLSREFLL